MAVCGGVRQSPINIDTNQLTFDPSLRNLTFSDITNPHSIKFLTNNGHTVSCVLEGLMEVRGGGLPHGYTAVMMHFHWGGDSLCHPGSEHTVDSVRYPMEIHLVTLKEGLTMEQAKTDPERIAVFGFFIDVAGNQWHVESWRTLTSYLLNITEKGSSVDIVQPLSISDLLGSVDLTKFYRYQGSLTTPTCDEVVVERFPKTLKYRNIYRPVQRLNGRPVYASPGVSVSLLGDSSQTSSRGALSPGLFLLLLLDWG
ncbi:carbonic anhydrase 6-like [Oncorhynchus clarkii lewisi]|uniref:carbonic anhydrase 6-like n=1 Tax=Oncorhynchus clarkii lewisi TaxID=490388 RepID=UPI0039B96BF3